jgi:hypothetical protein
MYASRGRFYQGGRDSFHLWRRSGCGFRLLSSCAWWLEGLLPVPSASPKPLPSHCADVLDGVEAGAGDSCAICALAGRLLPGYFVLLRVRRKVFSPLRFPVIG